MSSKTMSSKCKKKPIQFKPQLTPEQQRQIDAEQSMMKYIDENGIEAMFKLQVEAKLNDVKSKAITQSNIKAWFETRGELIDVFKELGSDDIAVALIDEYQFFKVKILQEIASMYETLIFDMFNVKEDDFVNPFSILWAEYENNRKSIMEALRELYAWQYLQDPVIWAAGMNRLINQQKQPEFVEPEEA